MKRVTVESTGKVVINGYFNAFNGNSCGFMVRLFPNGVDTNGHVDTSFNIGTGADDRIWNSIKLGDGSWIVLGGFHSFSDSPLILPGRLGGATVRSTRN